MLCRIQKGFGKSLVFAGVLLALQMFALRGLSQISVTGTGTVTQTFDAIGSSATAALPTGFRIGGSTSTSYTSAGTATTAAGGTSGTGALTVSSTGAIYNFANGITASSTDRSIGFLNSSGFVTPGYIYMQLVNNTGGTLTQLNVSFDYEKYRSGMRAWDWAFGYGTDGASFTDVTAGAQTYAADGSNAVVNPPTTITKTFTITGMSIANGATFYLQWKSTGSAGSTNAQGIGIDNISISAPAGCTTPTTTYSVTGTGSFCAGSGLAVGLANSQTGVTYSLYRGATFISTVNGTAAAVSFGTQSVAGTYSVLATSGSCTAAMTTTATLSSIALPTAYTTTGGGGYCPGGAGVAIGLANSQTGINYTLYRGATLVTTVSGTSAAISFGTQSVTGTYTVLATTATGSCNATMTGSATVSVNPLPAPTIDGTATIASGASTVLAFTGVANDVVYYWNGASTVTTTIGAGGTSTVTVTPATTTTYSITSATSALGCTATITGQTATVTISASPTASIDGSASICPGSSASLTISGTAGATVYYHVGASTTPLNVVLSGVSGVGTFTLTVSPSVTTTYTLDSIISGGYHGTISDNATITLYTPPTAYALTGGGSYCSGGAGVAVGLANSQTGVNYRLYNGASTVGSPVAGTGAAISFGIQTLAATYTVLATSTVNSCTSAMTGSATVSVNPLPAVTSISTNGPVCQGANLGLSATVSATTAPYVYSWSGPGAFTSTLSTSVLTGTATVTSIAASPATPVYTVSVTDANGCLATGTRTVSTTVTPFSAGTLSGSTAVYIGLTSTLSSTVTGGIWSSGNTARATIGSLSGVVTGVSAGTAGITYTYTSGCGSVTATTVVTVSAISATTISSNAWLTPGTSASGPSTFATVPTTSGGVVTISQWDRGAGAGVGSAGSTYSSNAFTATDLSGAQSGNDYIFFTITNNSNTETKITQLNLLTALSGTGPTQSQLFYQVGSGTEIGIDVAQTMSSSTTSVSYDGVACIPPGQTATFKLYAWSGGSGGTFRVNSGTTIAGSYVSGVSSLTATASNSTPVCASASFNLNATPANGVPTYIYSWVGPSSYSSTAQNATASATSAGVYTVTVTDLMGCTAAATTTTTINAAPAAIGGVSAICVGAITTLTNTTTGGTWSSSNTTVATIGTSGLVNGLAAGTSIITYTGTNGCFSTKIFTVNALPSAITGASSVCQGSTTTLSTSSTGGTWSSGASFIATVGTSGIVNGVGAGVTAISYTSAAGCVTSTPITVNALPSVASITGTTNVCVGNTSALTNATTGGVWSSSNTGVASVGSTGIVTGVSANTAIISYGVTNEFGCIAYATTTITVNPLPTVNAITGISSVCVGNTTTLSSTTTGGVWSSSNTGVASVGSTGIVTGVSANTATITYTVTSGFGCVTFVTNTVTVNPLPTVAAITGISSVCVGNTTTLNSTTTGGVWSSSNPGVASVGSTGIVTGVSANTAIITYTVTSGFGCVTFVTNTITVNPLPTVAAITGISSVCVGNTTTLSSTTTGGVWTSSDAGVATVGSTGIVTGVSANTATVTYTVTSGFGCVTFVTNTVTVNPLPTVAAITGTSSVCVGNTTTLSNTTTGGVWTSSDAGVASVGSTGIVTGVSANTATITYTVTSGFGCVSFVTNTVTVNPLPTVAAITGTSSVCVGNTTTLSSTTTGGVWSSSNTGVASVGSTGIVTGVSANTATITYTVTSGFGCVTFVTNTVTVNPLPTVAAITGTSSVCVGNTTTLSSTTTGGVWSSSNPGVASVGSTGIVTGVSANTATITYTVTSGFGCVSFVTNTVTVNPLPTVAAITGTSSVCVGNTTTLSSTTTGGVWSSSNTGVASVGSTGIVTGVSANTATITYTVTNGFGCVSFVTNTVTVNPLPTVAAITGTSSVCVGNTTTLSSTTTGGVWSSSNTGVASVGSTGIVTGVSANTATITYTVTSGFGCVTFVTNTVTVNPLPTVAAITGTSSVCVGNTTTLSSTTTGGVWTSSDASVASVGSTGIVTGVSANTATITYTVTSGFGCVTFVTNTVTVNPLPTVAAITGTSSACVGNATTLSSTTTGGVWSSSNTGVASVGSTGIVTGVSANTATITYTVTSGFGCVTFVTNTVTVNPMPTVAAITGTSSVCVGNTTTTLSSTTTGGVWSSSNTGVASVGSTGIVTGVSANTATITYTVTSGFGCVTFVTNTVTVNPLPTVAAITGTSSVCVGNTTTLSSTTTGGVWSSSNPGVASVGSTGIVTGVSANTATITYTVTSGFGCVSFVTNTVTVNPLPTVAAITGTSSVCVGNTTTLSSTTTGGVWSSSNTGVASVGSTGIVTGVSANTATITYTVTNGFGCVSFVTNTVTVNPLPTVAAITGTSSVCVGNTTTLSSTTTGGVWSSSNTGVASVGSTGIVTGVSANTAVITYTVTSGFGCVTFVTNTVTVNPLPTVAAITGTSSVCVGNTTTLSSTTTGGVWSSSNPGVASVGSTGIVTGVSANTAIITYTVTSGFGCVTFVTNTVTVNPMPTVAAITGTSSVCVGNTTTLSSTTTGGVWTSSNPGVASVGSTGIVTGVSANTATITYTVTSGFGCVTFVTNTVTVNPLPTVAAITGTPSVCVGNTTTLSSTTTGGVWSSSDAGVASVGSTGIVTGVSANTAIITYTVTSGFGCVTFVTNTVTVNPLPTVAAITGTSSVCVGNTTTLSSTTTGGVWSSSNTGVASVGSTGIVTGVSANTATITYTVTNGFGCVSFVTNTITVNPLPTVAAITGTSSVCVGNTTTLSSTTTGGVWSSSNTGVASVGSTGIVTGVSANTATITYTVTSGFGCVTFVTNTVTVNPLPTVAAITGTLSVCVGNTTTLSSTTTGGVWSSSDAGVASVGSTGIVTGVSAHTATITYTVTSGFGCVSFVTNTVTVNPLPTVAAITGGSSVCVGNTTALSSTTTGGVWTSSNPGVASVGSTGIVTGVSANTATITYTVTSGFGCVTFVTNTVTVNPLPTVAAITGTSSVCVGNTTTLSSTTTGGVWTSSNIGVASVGSTGIVTGVSANTATITYTVTSGFGCVTFVTNTVTVNPLPTVAAITGGSSVCVGNTTTLSSTTTGGVWTSSNTGVASVGSTGIVTGVSANTAIITYTVNSGFGCVTFVTNTVTVNPLPTVAAITGTSSVCVGNTTTLSSTTTGGVWTSSNTGVAYVGSTGIVTGVSANTAIITYTVTSEAGCITFVTRALTVNPLPTVNAITGTLTVCQGATTALGNTTTGGTWSSIVPSVATVSTAGVVTAIAAGTATISYTRSNGFGCIAAATAVVTVNAIPTVSAITGTNSVCIGGSSTLSTTSTDGNWSSNATSIATVDASGIVSSVGIGTAVISYSVTNSFGCAGAATTVFTVNALPSVAAITGTPITCTGATMTLADATTGGTWGSSNTAVASIGSTGIVSALTAGTTIITYTVTNGAGCTNYVTRQITINASPATISGAGSVCQGSTTTLANTTSGGTWSSNATGVATVGVSTGVVTGIAGGSSTISYITSFGCFATTVISVNPLPAAITGASSVCAGLTTTFASTSTGGTWSSSNTASATVNSGGVVSGVASGTSIITYTSAAGCFVTKAVTVANISAITGSPTLCIGLSTTLANSTSGGTWTSSNTTVATVNTTGVVSGVAAGTSTISYSLGGGCATTLVVTVNSTPGAISGITSVCAGSATTLSNSVSGGVWSSSNTTIATAGSASGIVTGVNTGTATISYTLGAGCVATTTVTVGAIAPITGVPSVCVGLTTALSDATTGGTWSSSDTAVATISGSGIVTGVSIGVVNITYALSTGCSRIVSVNVHPLATAITGTTTACAGSTATLNDTEAGGVWSSSNAAIATVGSVSGIVTGVNAGTATITYTIGSACRTTTIFTVVAQPATISGAPVTCVGTTTTLSNTTTGGTWSSSNTAVASVSTSGVVTGNAAGTAIISYTAATGCARTVVVTVNASTSTISGTASVCTGATTTLAYSGSDGTWASGNTAVATVTGTGVVTGITAGSAPITFTLTSGCRVTTIVTVNTAPDVIGGPSGVCIDNSITLTNANAGGTWSSSNTSRAIVYPSTGVVTGVAAGTVTITYSLSGSCYRTKLISVNTPPTAILGATTFCVGSPAVLTDTTAGGVSWTSGNHPVAVINNTSGLVTPISAGTADITYTLSTGCYTVSNITVNPQPAAISGPSSICLGSAATLSTTPTGGTWVSNSVYASIDSSTGVVTGMGVGTSLITYYLGTGCRITSVISVNAIPSAITGATTVCLGSTSALGNSSTGGTWSSSDNTIATVATTGVVSGLAPGTAVISYSFATGCSKTVTVTVDPAVPLITGSLTMCLGLTSTLSNTATGGTWSSGNPSVATVSSTGAVTGVAIGSATITYTTSGGCRTVVTVNINPVPNNITGVANACVGATATLSTTSTGGTWSSSNTAVATVGSASGVVTGMVAGSVTISYAFSNGCYRTYSFTVKPLPAAITGTTTLCVGGSATLSNTTSVGASWSSSDATIASIGSGSGVVTGIATGTATITYTINTGCISTTVVSVVALPSAITGTTVCAGSTATLTATPAGGSWTSGSSSIANINAASGVVMGVAAGTASVTYSIGAGCNSSAVVTVNGLPVISGSTPLCVGSFATLSSTVTGGVWSSDNTSVATISSTGVVSGAGTGNATISYTLPTGCVGTTVLTVNAATSAITGTASVCAGATTALSNATTGGTWSSSNTTVATVGTAGIVSGVSSGTATITYALSGGCRVVATVTVNGAPAAIAGGTQACVGSDITLSDADAGGTWSSSNTAFATVGSSSGIVSGVVAGSVTITYTLPTGCYNTATIVVNSLPSAISGASVVCIGTSAVLTNSTSGGVMWSSSDATVATIGSSSGLVSGLSAGTTIITYTVSTGCMATKVLTVSPALSSITGISPVCVGATLAAGIAETGGVWSSGSSTIATVGSGSGIVTGVGAGVTTITYTLGTCTRTASVSVNAVPGSITGVTSLCISSTVTLSSSPTGGVWSSADATIASVGTNGIVTGVAGGVTAISYTAASGCFRTTNVTVNVLPAITSSATICTGTTEAFTNATTGGTWSSSTTGVATINASNGIANGIAVGTTNITYTLTAGCRVSKTVTVIATPAAITGATAVCLNATATVINTTTGGTWSSSNTALATVASATGVVTGMAVGTPVITYTAANGCFKALSFPVRALPAPISGTGLVCAGGTGSLSDATSGGVSWTSSTPSIATIGSANGVVTGVSAGTSTMTYTVNTGCFITKVVTVSATPNAGVITGPSSVSVSASSGTPVLYASSFGGGTWTSSSTARATIGASSGLLTGVSAGAINVTYTLNNGCGVATATMPVTITTPRAAGELAENTSATTIQLYPNPTTGTFTINAIGAGIFSMYTLEGKQVGSYTIATGEQQLTMPDLAAGIYMCRFMGNDGTNTMVRLVYER